jgi:Protein of unknown function (DUF2911)
MTIHALGCTSLFLIALSPAFAQSPPETASIKVDGKAISISYSAPSVRGRQIFGPGGLLSTDPTYPAWRAGANSSTAFRTAANLQIGSLNVPKGDYTLYCWIKDPETWDLIISKQTGQWGLEYNEAQDLGRVKMTMSKPPSVVEMLKYTLADQGGGKVKLQLEWERHIASVIMTVKE